MAAAVLRGQGSVDEGATVVFGLDSAGPVLELETEQQAVDDIFQVEPEEAAAILEVVEYLFQTGRAVLGKAVPAVTDYGFQEPKELRAPVEGVGQVELPH